MKKSLALILFIYIPLMSFSDNKGGACNIIFSYSHSNTNYPSYPLGFVEDVITINAGASIYTKVHFTTSCYGDLEVKWLRNGEVVHSETGIYEDPNSYFYNPITEPGNYVIQANALGKGQVASAALEVIFAEGADPLSTNVSISELVNVQLFPNPCYDKITIGLPANDPSTLKIYNSSGAIVYSKNGDSAKMEMNLETLVPGIYYLEIIMGEQRKTKIFQKL